MSAASLATMGRQARAIRLLTCLQGGAAFTAKELAQRLKVSLRTVYRDLSLIRHAGIDVRFDTERCGYRLAGHEQRTLLVGCLDERDVAKLALTAHLSILCASPQFRMSVRESLARLLLPFPLEVRQGVANLLSCCEVDLPRPDYPDRVFDVVETLLYAMAARRVVRLDVRLSEMGTKRAAQLRFAPYHLVAGAADWWLYGRSLDHQRVVRLAVSRITKIAVSDDPYQMPPNFRARLKSGDYKVPFLS